jgi:AcrR family transcriptional regulator
MSRPPLARDAVLDAAAAVVAELGPTSLTLEAVAAGAGVSKGGLLYHFPSKDALIAGLVERAIGDVNAFMEAHLQDDDSPGAFARAYAAATIDTAAEPADLISSIAAAAALNSDLLEPVRRAYATWQERLLHDGLPPERALLLRLAVDGWWLSTMIGVPVAPRRHAAALKAEILALTR